jgi:hypothetical protein
MRKHSEVLLAELLAEREAHPDPRADRASTRGPGLLDDRVTFARDRRGDEESDPRLIELTTRAKALIDALRAGAPIRDRPWVVGGYVRAARAIGVVGERLHDALELLVNEHARPDVARRLPAAGRHPEAVTVLHDVLRVADPGFGAGRCPHAAMPARASLPHWCRLQPRPR